MNDVVGLSGTPAELNRAVSESLACGIARWLATNQIVAIGILMGAAGLFVLLVLALGRRLGLKRPGVATTTPWLVASWLLCLFLYLGGRLADLLFTTEGVHRAGLTADEIARAGWVEVKLLADTSLWPLVPLESRLPVAFLLHSILWGTLLLVFYGLLAYFTNSLSCKVGEIADSVRGWYRLTGCSTDRGLDASVRSWLVRLCLLVGVAITLCLASYAGVHQNTLQLAVDVCLSEPDTPLPGIAARSPGMSSPHVPPASEPRPLLAPGVTATAANGAGVDLAPSESRGLAPGFVVLFLLLLPVIGVHAVPPAPWFKEAEEEKPPAPETSELVPPIVALRAGLETAAAGVGIAPDLEISPSVPTSRAPWPEGAGGLLRRMLDDLVLPAAEQPYRTQSDVVALVQSALKLAAEVPRAPTPRPTKVGAKTGDTPAGVEHGASGRGSASQARSVAIDAVKPPKGVAKPETLDPGARVVSSGARRGVSALDLATTALLVTGPDGAGRLSALLGVAVATYHERGGSTVLLCRDRARARAVVERFRAAVASSVARWSVLLADGAEGLRNALVTARVPALVIVELHALEQIVLVEGAGTRLLLALDAVLVDQLDEFVGVREMHLSLVLRRLWLALEGLERRPEPPLVIATAASSRGELGNWASQLLGRRCAVLPYAGPGHKERILVRRRQLLGGAGREPGILDVAWACELAELPWHLRMSGPGRRRVQRIEGQLAALGRMRVTNPSEAAVVILEGAFGEVENERLVTALVAKDAPYAHGVHVAVPPAEDELVLEPLGASLPWVAAPLDAPIGLRELHLSRALSHDEMRRAGVLDVLLGPQGQKLLESWEREGRLQSRSRWVLRPGAYQPEEERLVSRAAGAPPLVGLDVQCATRDTTRLVQEETGETLERVDAELGGLRYYPGAVLLLEQGRFQVPANLVRRTLEGGFAARLVEARLRSVPERLWTLRGSLWQLAANDRSMGREALRCRVGALELLHRVVAVRSYSPDGAGLERRELSPPLESVLDTRGVLLMTNASSTADPSTLRPIVSVLALLMPSLLRTARDLLHVGIVEASGAMHIALVERTPGGNGVAALVDESLLVALMRAASKILGVLPTTLQRKLCERFDEHPADPRAACLDAWDVAGAMAWLEAIAVPGVPSEATAAPLTATDSGNRQAVADPTYYRRLCACFPPLENFPPEEADLFCEWVNTALTEIPIRPRYGANPTEDDRLAVMAGLAAVFYRRPDLALPKGFYVAIEPGRECHRMPGSSGYCQCFHDWHFGLSLDSLRMSRATDGYALVAHEAAHLMDALDGTGDGLVPGMTARERIDWLRATAAEIPRAASGQSLLRTYAATNPAELLAEAVGAFVELPRELKQRLPALYAGLCAALRQDPVAWMARKEAERIG